MQVLLKNGHVCVCVCVCACAPGLDAVEHAGVDEVGAHDSAVHVLALPRDLHAQRLLEPDRSVLTRAVIHQTWCKQEHRRVEDARG